MPEPAIAKVEDALAAAITGAAGLEDFTVLTDHSADVAIPDELDRAIIVYTTGYVVDQADEQHQSMHTATIEFEVISRTQAVGTINRTNHAAIANIIAALHADRTLGGRLIDLQEVDVAPAGPNGKDAGSASLQINAWFFTPRGDWFTILGQAGEDF